MSFRLLRLGCFGSGIGRGCSRLWSFNMIRRKSHGCGSSNVLVGIICWLVHDSILIVDNKTGRVKHLLSERTFLGIIEKRSRGYRMKVIKIGASWCSGCLVMRPRWEKIERENKWIKSEYCDYDENGGIVNKYSVEEGKLPVFIVLDKNDKELYRRSGEVSEKEVLEVLSRYKGK